MIDLRLIHFQSFHQPPILLRGNASGVLRFPRPLEASVFQSLVEQDESVPIPIQPFDPVGTSSAEQKQCLFKWIKPVLFLNQTGQSIDTSAKIGIATRNDNLIRMEEFIQHDSIASRTDRMVSSSAPWKTFAVTPFISMLMNASPLGTGIGTS